jgi:hypothetical protein
MMADFVLIGVVRMIRAICNGIVRVEAHRKCLGMTGGKI